MRDYDPLNTQLADKLNPQGCGVKSHKIDCLCDVDLDTYGGCPQPTAEKLREQQGVEVTTQSLQRRMVEAERRWFLNKFWPDLIPSFRDATSRWMLEAGERTHTEWAAQGRLAWQDTRASGKLEKADELIEAAAAIAHRISGPGALGFKKAIRGFAEWQYLRLPHMSKADMVEVVGEWDPTVTCRGIQTSTLKTVPTHPEADSSGGRGRGGRGVVVDACRNGCTYGPSRRGEAATRDGLCGKCHAAAYELEFAA